MHNKVFIVSRGVSNLFYVQLISFASCIVGYLNKILDHLAHHSTGHAIRMATTICSSNLHFLRLTKTIQSVHYSSRHHPFTWINPECFLLKCRLYMYIHTHIYNYIYILYICVCVLLVWTALPIHAYTKGCSNTPDNRNSFYGSRPPQEWGHFASKMLQIMW